MVHDLEYRDRMNRITALAESAMTCGVSRVISGGEACEALSQCVGAAPPLRFTNLPPLIGIPFT